jgi:acetolactate decarboxylase
MIMIDGRCYQARSDGSVTEAPDSELTPFATVVNFAADSTAELGPVASFDDLTAQIDAQRASDNGIVSFLASGTFSSIRVRTACKTEPGIDLVEATANQRLFDFENISGTLVGFWSPEYTKAIAIAGYHVHFISDDRQHGGHVLDLTADGLHLEINDVNDVRLAIPETAAFLAADLSGDHSEALDIAERGHRGR